MWREKFLAAFSKLVKLRGWVSCANESELQSMVREILAREKMLALHCNTPHGQRMLKSGDGNDYTSASYAYSKEEAVIKEMVRVFIQGTGQRETDAVIVFNYLLERENHG